MDVFGCCSHYISCSDKGYCLFTNVPEYTGCHYAKNLAAGRIFYGSNARKSDITSKAADKLFLDCYDRHFKVSKTSKGLSYPLNEEDISSISDVFKENNIPHTFDEDESKCITEGDREEPANARVILDLPGHEKQYVIANYNSWFIKKRYADGIAAALTKKGITAKVELVGKYAYKTTYNKQAQGKIIEKSENKPKPSTYVVPDDYKNKSICFGQIDLFGSIAGQTKEKTRRPAWNL